MTDRRRNLRFQREASLTVEAAFIVTFAVLAAGILISLGLFVYQRCRLTQAACETAMMAGGQCLILDRDSQALAQEKWEDMQQDFALLPEDLSVSVAGDSADVSIEISGQTPIWGRDGLAVEASVGQKIVEPAGFVRKLAALCGKGEGG